MWRPKQFWVESRGVQGAAQNKFGQFFTFLKLKKKITDQRAVVQCGAQNSFGGEPRFKGLPKTVLGGF